MNQNIKDYVGASAQMLRHLVVFGSLLFSVGVLSFYPLGSALRYYADLLALLSLIYLFLARHEIDWVGFTRGFMYCCAPFLPFLIVYVVVKIYHGISLSDDGIYFQQLLCIFISAGLVFGVLIQSKRISRNLFFACCAIGSVLYFSDVVATAWINEVPVWKVKPFVHPYSTTYARCISITSGLALLGFFLLPNSEKRLRLACFGASILGFCSSIWFMEIRSVILAPIFAFFIGYCASPLRKRTKVLTLLIFGLVAAIVVVQGPVVTKMRTAYEEVANVVSTDAVNVILSNLDKQEQLPQKAKIHKYLNTSVGARLAVWGVAGRALEDHVWMGTGKGRPNDFVNTRKLFKFSKQYLEHFHSDYVQVGIVGGALLLISFLVTQVWLLIRSFNDPLTLFMTLSMIIYGTIDYGFLDRRVLVCYLGACLVVWSWHYTGSWLLVSDNDSTIAR